MGLICKGIKLFLKFMRIRRYRKKYEKAKKLGATTSPATIAEIEMSSVRRKKLLLDVLTCFICRKKSYDETIKSVKTILTHKETYQFFFFIYGLIFSWILFSISYYVGSDDRSFLAAKSVVLVTVVSFSMAYSRKLRCITSLLTPIVLTSKGRYIILVIIANLLVYGPITNIRVNLSENGRIIKCVAEVILEQVKLFITQNPIVNFFKRLVVEVNKIFTTLSGQLKGALTAMHLIVRSILHVLEHAKEFSRKVSYHAKRLMANIRGWCSTNLSNKHKACLADYDAISGEIICSSIYAIRGLCFIGEAVYAVPTLDLEWVKNHFVNLFNESIKALEAAWETFYGVFKDYLSINITMKHDKILSEYEKTNYSTALDDLHKKIDSRMGIFVNFCKALSYISYLLFLYCILRAWLYLKRFLIWDSFDNVYITSQIHKIDWERSLAGKPTILPLGYILSQKYISPFSIRMTSDELRKLQINLIVYFTFIVSIGIFLVLEHIIYAPLALTKKYITEIDAEIPLPTIKIFTDPENGAMADILKKMGDFSSKIENITDSVDSIARCTPDPIPPDYDLYQNIGFLTLTVLIAILCESYALRLRFLIAGSMYPSRKFARSAWLYNRILSSAPLAKLDAKGKIRAKVLGNENRGAPSQVKRFMYLNPFTAKIYNLFAGKQKYCIVCGQSGPLNDTENFIKCINIDCKAIYCKPCYSEFDKACPLCEAIKVDPKVAAIDEEKGSSEDEEIFEYVYDDDWTFRGPDTESEPEIEFKKLELRPPKDFSKYLKPRNIEDGPVDSDASTTSERRHQNVKKRGKNLNK